MHQVCKKCGQFCPHFNKIVHTFRPIGTLFTYTVHIYSLPLLFKCGQFCPHFVQIVHTFWGRVHYSHKTLFTYLTESVDKIVHTFWKRVHYSHETLFTYLTESLSNCPHFLGMNFTVHLKYYLRIWQKSVDKIVYTFIKLSTLFWGWILLFTLKMFTWNTVHVTV